jgi:hypothetical protein
MRKILFILLAIIAVSFAGCGDESKKSVSSDNAELNDNFDAASTAIYAMLYKFQTSVNCVAILSSKSENLLSIDFTDESISAATAAVSAVTTPTTYTDPSGFFNVVYTYDATAGTFNYALTVLKDYTYNGATIKTGGKETFSGTKKSPTYSITEVANASVTINSVSHTFSWNLVITGNSTTGAETVSGTVTYDGKTYPAN